MKKVVFSDDVQEYVVERLENMISDIRDLFYERDDYDRFKEDFEEEKQELSILLDSSEDSSQDELFDPYKINHDSFVRFDDECGYFAHPPRMPTRQESTLAVEEEEQQQMTAAQQQQAAAQQQQLSPLVSDDDDDNDNDDDSSLDLLEENKEKHDFLWQHWNQYRQDRLTRFADENGSMPCNDHTSRQWCEVSPEKQRISSDRGSHHHNHQVFCHHPTSSNFPHEYHTTPPRMPIRRVSAQPDEQTATTNASEPYIPNNHCHKANDDGGSEEYHVVLHHIHKTPSTNGGGDGLIPKIETARAS